jgi:uncharacterized protein (DUF3820 family)
MTQNTGVPDLNPQALIELTNTRMPFGKYKGRFLCDLPEPYVVWFHQKGFPQGKLGMQLSAIYEIKANGLEYLLKPLKQHKPIG